MDNAVIWESETGIFMKISVKPKSKKKDFLEYSEDEIIVNLHSAAKNGKANSELIKRMSKFFNISTNMLRIVAGHKSKTKTLLIVGLSMDEVKTQLHTV